MNKFNPVTHVIFDLDGTLIDTEKIHQETFTKIAKEFGKEFPYDLRVQLLGMQELDCANLIIDTLKLDISPEAFLEKAHALDAKEMSNVTLMPGVQNLLEHFRWHGIPMAVATSSSEMCFKMKTNHLKDYFEGFDHVVTGSSDPEVKRGKPAPDIFQICASRFPEKPIYCQCLVFEDSPNGVTAAIAADMQVVMIPEPTLPKELTCNATVVLNSLEEFCPEMFSLPFIR